MKLEKVTHEFYEALKDVLFKDIPAATDNKEKAYKYYYAENQLYIFKNKLTGGLYFSRGSSPQNALDNIKPIREQKGN